MKKNSIVSKIQNIKKFIINYKLTFGEILIKKNVIIKLKKEMFDIKWTYNFYKLYFFSKYKNTVAKPKKIKQISTNLNENCKNALVRVSHLNLPNYFIKFGKSDIQNIFWEKEIYKALIDPLLSEERLWQTETNISKEQSMQTTAYKFFMSWNEFLIDNKWENSCIVERDPIFPLNETQDFFFYKEILALEQKYGCKITSFIAIHYINRMLNDYNPGIEDIEKKCCDLAHIFRHKNALGWFIALLKAIAPKIEIIKTKEFNINEMIVNLTYIYDILEEKYNSNKIAFPLIFATLLPIFATQTVATTLSLYTQSKLLMLEVMPYLKIK